MIIMVINSGSSSLKYQLFDMGRGAVIAKGLCERIGIDGLLNQKVPGKENINREISMPNHEVAMRVVIDSLISSEHGVLKSLQDITAVGHRVAHGGDVFTESVLITAEVLDTIRSMIPLAPLHNPAAIMGIEACSKVLGEHIPQVAVFDTAFHQTIPQYSYTYALPHELCEKHRIRRYGFHGTSHKYVASIAAEEIGVPLEQLRVITCHLGNGSSIAAVKNGKSIDTSMGFTPLEGLPMGTRSGAIDPAILPFLMIQENMDAQQIDALLNKQSGMMGMSGVSPDLRDIEEQSEKGNARAQIAIDVLCYHIKKYLGAYTFAMGGLDAIVFTAGIGENSTLIRESALAGLEGLGIVLDLERNRECADDARLISSINSRVKIFVIPTNEELVIARDTQKRI